MQAESTVAVRRAFAHRLALDAHCGDDALEQALADTAREDFMGPPPWLLLGSEVGRLWSDDPRELYQDVLVSLDEERGINNGQPSLHARCIAACDPRPGETVLHVGAGTGYYSAVLARLVGPAGRVIAYEIEPDLAARAATHLAGLPQAEVHATSGAAAPLPAADVIYVSAGATHPLPVWLDALRIGGRLMFPLTPDAGTGCMLLLTRRTPTAYAARALMRVAFIACIGARDDEAARTLRHAMATRPIAAVRSLRRDDAPDDSAWAVGRGWWLSEREVSA